MSKNTRTRILLTAVAALLLVTMAVGGTIAWLQDVTAPVVNTFSTSNIDITLTETTTDYKMVPGRVIAKDPVVTVHAVSEASYLFVKIEKSANYDTYLENYVMADGWERYNTTTGTLPEAYGLTEWFWKKVDAVTTGSDPYYVLAGSDDNPNGQVVVKEGVTNTQMDAAEGEGNAPKLTFTAYAVQSEGVADEDAAYALVKDLVADDIYGKTTLN